MREALAGQGFGVLTEIDVAATLKAKLGIDGPALKILGACNPTLAHQALEIDPSGGSSAPVQRRASWRPSQYGDLDRRSPNADARPGVRRARRRCSSATHRRA